MNTVEYFAAKQPSNEKSSESNLFRGREREKHWLKNTEEEEYERLKNGSSEGKRERGQNEAEVVHVRTGSFSC